MTPADPFGLAGTIVDGRYRVEGVVGQGGFGVVYRAQHLGFHSPVALKVLRLPDDWSNERRQARIDAFQREGRVLFTLSHLHTSVVRALETGSVRSRSGALAPYLALEWLDGVALDVELKARRTQALPPLSLPAALHLLHGAAEGLIRAHAAGIAHRDIKPGNLFIATRGNEQCLKVLDFGVAKLVDEQLETTERFTRTLGGSTSFTPLYAAPEQWLERLGATGAWTDVHALALVVVELLAGRAPFLGRDSQQLMAACLDPLRPTPHACGANVSAEVDAVFARALALEPRARFADAGAFWQALVGAAGWQPNEHAEPLLDLAARPVFEAAVAAQPNPPVAPPLTLTGTTAPSVSLPRVTRAPIARASRTATSLAAIGAVAVLAYGLGARATGAAGVPRLVSANTAALERDVAPAAPVVDARATAPARALALEGAPVSLAGPLAPEARVRHAASHTAPSTGASSSAVLRRVQQHERVAATAVNGTLELAPSASAAAPAAPTASVSRVPVDIDDPALLSRK